MPEKNFRSPKKISLGRTGNSISRTPTPIIGKGGRISTNWQNINWTPRKKITVVSVLAFPYTVAVIACFSQGIYLVAYILLGLAILIGLVILAVYLIDQSDL